MYESVVSEERTENLKNIIISQWFDSLIFIYKNKKYEIKKIEINGSGPAFELHAKERIITYYSVEALIYDDFFEGKSLADICEKLDFWSGYEGVLARDYEN